MYVTVFRRKIRRTVLKPSSVSLPLVSLLSLTLSVLLPSCFFEILNLFFQKVKKDGPVRQESKEQSYVDMLKQRVREGLREIKGSNNTGRSIQTQKDL